MHGRPLAYSPDHYDTAFPKSLSENAMFKRMNSRSDVKPATDDVGKRTYETFIAHFRLCETLGRITRDALSQRAVPYSQLRAHDAELERLLDTSPVQSFPLWQIANCLKSTVIGPCRQGVQALVLRMAIHHVRCVSTRVRTLYTAESGLGSRFIGHMRAQGRRKSLSYLSHYPKIRSPETESTSRMRSSMQPRLRERLLLQET